MNGGSPGDIVIAGGYGHVGRAIAERLAPRYAGRVVVAGRSEEKARQAVSAIGHGSRGLRLDTAEGIAPDGAAIVIMCLDQFDPSFASDCFARGIGYVDISADDRILGMVEALEATALRGRTPGLIDVGLAPGLSNLLSRMLVETMENVVRLDLFVLLGAGDDHGPAAIEWTLDKFDSEFMVFEDGRPRWVRAQRETRRAEVPGRRNPVLGVRFDFPEQRSLVRTLGVPTVSSWMATLPPGLARSMRLAALAGGGELTRRPRSRRALLRILEGGGRIGTDECGVVVQATDAEGRMSEMAVLSSDQSALTASAAALMAAEMIDGHIPPGVHHSDEVIEPRGLLGKLAAGDPEIRVLAAGDTTITP